MAIVNLPVFEGTLGQKKILKNLLKLSDYVSDADSLPKLPTLMVEEISLIHIFKKCLPVEAVGIPNRVRILSALVVSKVVQLPGMRQQLLAITCSCI